MPKQPKTKGKLAKALSGAQAAQAQRQAQERAAQAERDRLAAVKAKMASGGGGAKRRKVAAAAAADGKGKARAEEDGDEREGGEDEADGPRERKKAGVQPFRRGERVLLVGEGNFSFSHSLLLPLSASAYASSSTAPPQPLVTPSLLLCTAFDTEPVATTKYPDLSSHVSALRAAGAMVLFGVDATKLEQHREVREFAGLGKARQVKGGKGKELAGSEDGGGFDKIVFNFPHVGQGITDQTRNIRTNQTLLLDFYRSASLLLRRGTAQAPGSSTSRNLTRDLSRSPSPAPGADAADEEQDTVDDPALQLVPPPPSTRGTVLLTLRTAPPYSLWLPAQLATKGSLLAPSILPAHEYKSRVTASGDQPGYRTVRSWAFEPETWEGYEHRRTIGWDARKSSGRNDDLTLTARERTEKRFSGGGGGGEAGGAKEGKGGKAEPPMRTWEFELVYARERREAAERGGAGKGKAGGKRKRGGAGEDPDLSDS
ncbi:hypothetical protein JCM10207_009226 [Rhodosporidiobolus poonsookiae]